MKSGARHGITCNYMKVYEIWCKSTRHARDTRQGVYIDPLENHGKVGLGSDGVWGSVLNVD